MSSSPSSASSSSHPNPITLHVAFRGTTHTLSLPPDTPLDALHARIEELTEVPPALQKLLYKGKRSIAAGGDATVEAVGLRDGVKVQMLGSTMREVEGVRAVEGERARREGVMHKRAMKPAVKVGTTGPAGNSISTLSSSSSSSSLQHRFHALQPLAHLPNPDAAHALLTKLSSDPAILHIMHTHQFSVGLLTELAPHEHPELLGLNENRGEKIKLRLRTDKYDGFRLYSDVRRVLCHELTHNVWGDHDENFKALNSKLNREVAEYERAVAQGTHYLSGRPGEVYEPAAELEAEARAYTLGGGASSSRAVSDSMAAFDVETQEERRMRVLAATMNRLRKEEEDIEHSCGTGKGRASRTSA
ncbi:DNA-dependent metalloprotease WSS1-like protein 2 [Psilocybe cubensis]|uniref:WLM-domain-containing protein n=2 Tax=Psilocybe cubensis TaxID=181762 RepID=A0A8H7XV38_PSICU|nr:DNA-dependent metalloprotease WSS1-like protein 2 [Psilocybe cubensis]KAH9479215.1 DNA-dependent metalloprotease WSS1-like protein 2 [Psilocybe cubensis]